MVFSSSLFLLYFLPIFLLFYHLFSQTAWKNFVILVGSIIFYSWGAPLFVFVVVASVFVDFHIIKQMHLHKSLQMKKVLLIFSVSINVGLLLYFKYANFFVENVNVFLQSFGYENIKWTQIGLPVGISFFTFQTLTYSIDVYRKVHAPLKSVSDYLMYIMLFPQLIAGPIVRFNEIADQIEDRKALETIDNKLLGFFRFVIGLAKKVLIANTMGAEADKVFALSEINLTTQAAWFGIVAYSFQIYFDFSGYSDMAIGMGRMLGFRFPENFSNPYISQSISEFWRRWHITLGRWMRDYLYIPLGGSRVNSKYKLYFNLWLVFLISGFWHGAAWNFILWGAFHGFFLIADRIFLLRFLKSIGKIPAIIFTYFVTLIGWVLFRSESLAQTFFYIKKMFLFDFSDSTISFETKAWSILFLATFVSFVAAFKYIENKQFQILETNYKPIQALGMSFLCIILFIISLSSITSSGFNPFIYFRF